MFDPRFGLKEFDGLGGTVARLQGMFPILRGMYPQRIALKREGRLSRVCVWLTLYSRMSDLVLYHMVISMDTCWSGRSAQDTTCDSREILLALLADARSRRAFVIMTSLS